MIKLIFMLMVVFSMMLLPVTAQDTDVADSIPADSIFAVFDRFFDNVGIAIARDKVRANLRVADERLREALVLSKKGANIDKIEKALKRRDFNLAKAEALSRSDEQKELVKTIRTSQVNRHIEVLESIRERFANDDIARNDNSIKAIDNAIEQSSKLRGDVKELTNMVAVDRRERGY